MQTTTEPYDPQNQNPLDQLKMMSFHQVAGGTDYTGLGHAALRNLEMTSLMQVGRGVLMGRVASPAARIVVDDQLLEPDRRSTFVRFVVPVKYVERAVPGFVPKAPRQP